MFENVQLQAEYWSADEVLLWAFSQFQPDLAIASAMGPEGIVLIDIASRVRNDLRVFTLDTDFLFPETYALMEKIETRYKIKIERVRAVLTPEQQAYTYGESLWSWDPDQCCNVRKVEPLRKKLAGLRAWATAIRRDQTPARAAAGKVEWDRHFGLVKLNPLADWKTEEVWSYIRTNGLPYNPLYDRNYSSIGCTHCTRAVRPGEHPRAGRWSGKEKTECGLHERKSEALTVLQPC
jgi:phosphoadenosine phosphosulfate reductase